MQGFWTFWLRTASVSQKLSHMFTTMPLKNEPAKSHADDKNPGNFSSSFDFFAIWEKLPRQMPKKDTGTNSDHSTAPSCKWRAIDFSFKLPVPERRLLLKRSCFWISSAKSCSWFLSSLFFHDSWLSQNESPLPIRFSVLLLLICSNGFERVRRGCLVMPTSVMAASITICNNISMENLNPWGGQISDGSDI